MVPREVDKIRHWETPCGNSCGNHVTVLWRMGTNNLTFLGISKKMHLTTLPQVAICLTFSLSDIHWHRLAHKLRFSFCSAGAI